MSCAALHLHAGVFTHTLRCAALLNAAYDELRCAALRCVALRCFLKLIQKSCFEAAFEAALLLKFCGVELHSADWLLKVCQTYIMNKLFHYCYKNELIICYILCHKYAIISSLSSLFIIEQESSVAAVQFCKIYNTNYEFV